MKKLILSAGALLIAASAFAQAKKNKVGSHLSLGPVAAFGHSWTSNLAGDVTFKPSPALGIGLVYSKNENWGLGVQLLASHEGYRTKRPIAGPGTAEIASSVNPVYLRLPLQVTYFFGKFGDKVRPKVYLGPSVAVRVDEKVYIDGESVDTDEEFFSRGDFGLTAGVGANIRLSRLTWLNLDAGYYHGFVDVLRNPRFTDEFNGNRNIRLNVGLMWGL